MTSAARLTLSEKSDHMVLDQGTIVGLRHNLAMIGLFVQADHRTLETASYLLLASKLPNAIYKNEKQVGAEGRGTNKRTKVCCRSRSRSGVDLLRGGNERGLRIGGDV